MIPRLVVVGLLGVVTLGCAAADSVNESDHDATIGTTAEAVVNSDGTLDARCNDGRDCGAALDCFKSDAAMNGVDRGNCLCRPGLIACGRHCVDFSTDRENCGACGNACVGSSQCYLGVCEGATALSVDTPVRINGESGACGTAFEGYPERSINDGSLFEGNNYSPDQCGHNGLTCTQNNRASAWNGWGSGLRTVPVTTGFCSQADPWTATSGYSQLEYISAILSPTSGSSCVTGTTSQCLGIAATSAANLATNTWSFPLKCINTGTKTDGPSIHYDAGGSTLWAAEASLNDGVVRLYRMPTCTGQPGSASCAVGSTTIMTSVGHQNGGHPSVVVNPCTHNAVVAFRDLDVGSNTSGQQSLAFVNGSGGIVTRIALATGSIYDASTNCAGGGSCASAAPDGAVCKCGGPGSGDCGGVGCARLVNRTQLATKYDSASGKCYAYAAWDDTQTCGGTAAFRAHFATVDITSESLPSIVASWVSTGCGTVNSFASISTANLFTTNVGWLYYIQSGGNPCSTYAVGWVSTDPKFATGLTAVQLNTTGFPTMAFAYGTMTDYNGVIKGGLPGGYLFPSWAQPTPSTGTGSPCVSCQGTWYDERVEGTRVLP